MIMEVLNTPKNISNSPRGLFVKRRSLITSTPLLLEVNDDDSERLQHRKSVIEQNKLNTSFEKSSIISTTKALPADQLEKLLESCLRMSAENKITPRNVWQIHVIQYLGQLYSKSSSSNLQIASAGLDASAKVYGLRVDSVYTNAIKIANDLSRQSVEGKKNKDDAINEDVQNSSEIGFDQRKKKKVKRNKKTIISNNPDNLITKPDIIETTEPILVQLTSKGVDINSSECLFQVILITKGNPVELSILSDTPYWDFRSSEDIDNAINTQLKVEIPKLPSVANNKICLEFVDFSLTDWSPEDEELRLSQQEEQEKMLMQRQTNDYAFDMDVTPLPIDELTNNVMNGFDANDSSEDEVVERVAEFPCTLKRRIEQIVDMRPTQSAAENDLEYSYNAIVTGMWAGPAHWKIKSNIQKATSLGNTANKENENIPKKKVKKVQKELEFNTTQIIDVACQKNTRLKRETVQSWAVSKNTLPTDLHIKIPDKLSLFLNPNIKFTIMQQSESPTLHVDENIPQYDYNNPNDSNFCVGTQADSDPENDEMGECNEMIMSQDCEIEGPFVGDNLISAPTMVPKNFISYALRAKRMDMKKLKAAVSKVVNDMVEDNEKENDQIENSRKKTSIKFSELYKSLPNLLSVEMNENLSCGLEFLALLHVANEENLKLICEDLTDFIIMK